MYVYFFLKYLVFFSEKNTKNLIYAIDCNLAAQNCSEDRSNDYNLL